MRYAVKMGTDIGCIGVTDADAAFDAASRRGGFAAGVEILDCGWRRCSNAFRSAEERGPLLDVDPDYMPSVMTPRIDSRMRVISARWELDEYYTDDDYVDLPVALPEDVARLRPWAVSAFRGTAFRLLSIELTPRAPWTPHTHALFPPRDRTYATYLTCLGYQLAARKLPPDAQGALCELWMSIVVPYLMDEDPEHPGECAYQHKPPSSDAMEIS